MGVTNSCSTSGRGPLLRPGAHGAPLAHRRGMDIERVQSAYRLGTIIALLYAFWIITPTVWPGVRTYFTVVAGTARAPRASADPNKLSAAKLESMLLESKQFPADSRPHCQPSNRDWDYVCSYMPTPS